MRNVSTLLVSIAVLVVSPAFAASAKMASPSPACSRECLFDVMNQYLDAMVVRHDIKATSLAQDVKATENGVAVPVGEGLWKTAQAITYRQLFADASTGQVGVHAVATEGGRAAIFAVRLKVVKGEIAEIETVVARTGFASMFAPEEMTTPNPIFEETLPLERRTPRNQMIAAANSYYEGIEHADGSRVAAAPGCFRVENGVQMEKIPALVRAAHCSAGFDALNYIRPVRNRRYLLVDEERGLVWAIALLDVQGSESTLDPNGRVTRVGRDPRTILVCELFKVAEGKLRRIDVVMRNIAFGAPSGWPDSPAG